MVVSIDRDMLPFGSPSAAVDRRRKGSKQQQGAEESKVSGVSEPSNSIIQCNTLGHASQYTVVMHFHHHLAFTTHLPLILHTLLLLFLLSSLALILPSSSSLFLLQLVLLLSPYQFSLLLKSLMILLLPSCPLLFVLLLLLSQLLILLHHPASEQHSVSVWKYTLTHKFTHTHVTYEVLVGIHILRLKP